MKRATKLEPRQDRSRRTLSGLLSACGRVLDRDGLEACTIPRVAAEASVAPATIYRRFADKDAMLRASVLHALRPRKGAGNRSARNAAKALLRPSLFGTVQALVTALLEEYRTHPGLLVACARVSSTAPDSHFGQEATAIRMAALKLKADVLLKHRDRIRHPDPERAVWFALLTVAAAIEQMVSQPRSTWHSVLPAGDDSVISEHARMMTGYLRRKP